MSDVADLGGDAPCWAHLVDGESSGELGALVVDLGAAPSLSGGAIWSLPHGGDLDANLVRLKPRSEIGAHVNDEVDVLIIVQAGSGELVVNNQRQHLGPDHLALIPQGSQRLIAAGSEGITYLSIHRRRGPLKIGRHPESEQS